MTVKSNWKPVQMYENTYVDVAVLDVNELRDISLQYK